MRLQQLFCHRYRHCQPPSAESAVGCAVCYLLSSPGKLQVNSDPVIIFPPFNPGITRKPAHGQVTDQEGTVFWFKGAKSCHVPNRREDRTWGHLHGPPASLPVNHGSWCRRFYRGDDKRVSTTGWQPASGCRGLLRLLLRPHARPCSAPATPLRLVPPRRREDSPALR